MAKPATTGSVRQPGRDPVYKDIYGHAFMVAELLRLLLAQSPEGLVLLAALDLSSLERMPEQSVSKRQPGGGGDGLAGEAAFPNSTGGGTRRAGTDRREEG